MATGFFAERAYFDRFIQEDCIHFTNPLKNATHILTNAINAVNIFGGLTTHPYRIDHSPGYIRTRQNFPASWGDKDKPGTWEGEDKTEETEVWFSLEAEATRLGPRVDIGPIHFDSKGILILPGLYEHGYRAEFSNPDWPILLLRMVREHAVKIFTDFRSKPESTRSDEYTLSPFHEDLRARSAYGDYADKKIFPNGPGF